MLFGLTRFTDSCVMKERSKDRGMSRYLVQKFGIGMPDRHFLHRVRAEKQCTDGVGLEKL